MKTHIASDCLLTESSGIFKAHSSQSRPATLTTRAGKWFSHTLVLTLACLPASSLLAQDVAITGDVDPSPATTPIWNLGSDNLTIGNTGNGTLNISGIGAVSNFRGVIGSAFSSTSSATVSGGSWTNSEFLVVGNSGNGTLNISGGAVSSIDGYISNQFFSTGSTTVSGGSWTNSRNLYVGQRGSGTLNISGGAVSNIDGYIGNIFGSNGIATLTGGSWTNSGNLYVGNEGSGRLNISGTGAVSNVRGVIGSEFNLGSISRATVSGGSWTNSESLYVGQRGNGTLNISGSGAVSNTIGYIGAESGSIGSVTVSGGSWTNTSSFDTGDLYIGKAGNGTLEISGTGAVSNRIGYIGEDVGSTGTATVSGGSWTNSYQLYVGNFGNGTLNISSGAVSNTDGYIGAESGSIGSVTVSGGSWTDVVTLVVGNFGNGTLEISGSGAVDSDFAEIGWRAGSTGTVTVSGGSWTNSRILTVGSIGNGTLNISGGAVSSEDGFSGADLGSTGSVTVSGGSWTNSRRLIVGGLGNGTLEISGSGEVSAKFSTIGNQEGSTGTATVSGGSWMSEDLYVGNRGNGTLEISGGEVFNEIEAVIGVLSGSTGTATVSGGSWTISGPLRVGSQGTGTLTISGTGAVSSSSVELAELSGSQGTLNLLGGTLSTGQVSEGTGTGTGTINFNGGTLRLTGDQADLFAGFETNDVTLNAGGGTIDTQGHTVATSQVLGGTGSLTKEGTGSLTLTGANTYSGGTEINGGILSIGADNHLGDASGGLSFDFAILQTTGSFSTSRDTTFDTGGGRFSTDASTTLTHTGTISGPGGLTKQGAGTLVLSGNNDFSGSTTISEGTLSLGSNTAAGTGAITTIDAVIDYADGVSISNLISLALNNNAQLQVLTGSATQSGRIVDGFGGTASLTKEGTGSLILTGANTYSGDTTISAGTLQIGNGGTTGMIAGDVTNNANLAFNRTDDYSFNGTISGSGNLIQRAGILNLSAAQTYTGSTTIEGGTLQLASTGSIDDSSGIDIASGATFDVSTVAGGFTLGTSQTLTGNGDILGDVTSAGMIAAGNSTGELRFTGNLSLVPSSMIQMEIGSLTDFDRIVVSDALTYGGTLGLIFLDGYTPSVGDTFDLFQGFSSQSGTFEDITVLASGYTTSFDYGTGDLTFTTIPEPSSLVLLGISVFTLTFFSRRRPHTT